MKRRVEDTASAWGDTANTIHIADEQAIKLTEALADFPVNPADPPSVCVRLNTSPDALEKLLALAEHDIGGETPGGVADAGFGGGRLMWWGDFSGENAVQAAERLRQIQSTAVSLGGDAIVESCPQAVKELIDVWGPAPSGMEIMRRINRHFDPKGLLNPGRFIGGL